MSLLDCKSKLARRAHNPCDSEDKKEKGRIRNLAFVRKGVAITYSDPATMITELLAAEKNCTSGYPDAVILRRTNGEYNGGEAETGEGRGDQAEIVTTKNHSLQIVDFDAIPNVDFWNDFEEISEDYNVIFFTEKRGWVVDDTDLTVIAKMAIANDVKADVNGEITVNWTNKKLPKNYTANVSGLKEYPTLGAATLTGSGSETISDNSISVAVSTSVDVTVSFTDVATNFTMKDGSTLPSWLTLDAVAGKLTGTAPAAAETSKFTVVGENDCGIQSEVEITVIVS